MQQGVWKVVLTILKIALAFIAVFAIFIACTSWFDRGVQAMQEYCNGVDNGTTKQNIMQLSKKYGFQISDHEQYLLIYDAKRFGRATCKIELKDGRSTSAHYQFLD